MFIHTLKTSRMKADDRDSHLPSTTTQKLPIWLSQVYITLSLETRLWSFNEPTWAKLPVSPMRFLDLSDTSLAVSDTLQF